MTGYCDTCGNTACICPAPDMPPLASAPLVCISPERLAELELAEAVALASEGMLVDAPALAVKERQRAEQAEARLAALRAACIVVTDIGTADGGWVVRACALCHASDGPITPDKQPTINHEPDCALTAADHAGAAGMGEEG